MDEIDQATAYLQRTIDESTNSVLKEAEKAKKRLIDMQEAGIENKCRYCNESIEGYHSSFCKREDDWSCAEEYQKEKDAERRNGKIV